MPSPTTEVRRTSKALFLRSLTVEDPITPEQDAQQRRDQALDRAFRTLHADAPAEYDLLLCCVPLELAGLDDLAARFHGLARLQAAGYVVRETEAWEQAAVALYEAIAPEGGDGC